MSNRRRNRRQEAPPPVEPIVDYGPGITRDTRGRQVSGFAVGVPDPKRPGKPKITIQPGAADVVLEDRPDPATTDRPLLIRGARRRLTLRDMLARTQITKRQHDAAVKFVDDLCVAAGPSRIANLSGLVSTPGTRDGVLQTQADAIRSVYRVVHLLGLSRDTVFWWVVVDNGSLRGYEERYQVGHGKARLWLLDALDALDRHYFGARGL